ncbi:MAG: hypothetical protein V4511_12985 [Bacteroidota bacterium]
MNLFAKNVFSVQSPQFSKLTNSETAELSSIIQKNYSDLIVLEIYAIGTFGINSNNWKIITNKEIFILKRATINKHEVLSLQAEWTSDLSASNFPTVRFMKNKAGKLISTQEQHIYCMTYFENGQYFGSFMEDWNDLIYNLKNLFDYCIKDNSIPLHKFPKREFFTPEEDNLIDQLKLFNNVKGIPIKQIAWIITEYEKSKKNFQLNQYNTTIFHTDLHPHNLIFNDHKLILLTDFESFQLTPLEVSLGFGLYKCLRQLFAVMQDHQELQLQASLNKFKDQFVQFFPEQNFKELIKLGKVDVLKRLLYIVNEILEKGESKWLFIFQIQVTSLDEINELERLLS